MPLDKLINDVTTCDGVTPSSVSVSPPQLQLFRSRRDVISGRRRRDVTCAVGGSRHDVIVNSHAVAGTCPPRPLSLTLRRVDAEIVRRNRASTHFVLSPAQPLSPASCYSSLFLPAKDETGTQPLMQRALYFGTS